ncbi:MAG: hypothetical protein QNJ15_14620 [Erythrobacter sp.]|nr:hypothetical protein [Erythrobacter sp.]
MLQGIRSLIVAVALILFGAVGAAAQNNPSVSLNSFLQYDTYPNGSIAIEPTDLAFAPAKLDARVVIRRAGGGKVAEHRFYEDYRMKAQVFGRMMPAQSPVEQLAPGDYVIEYYVGGKMVTAFAFSVERTSTSNDPFNPGSTYRFTGPWQQWAYLAPHSGSANAAASVYFWGGTSDVPPNSRERAFTAKAYRNGTLIAHSNPRTGNLGAKAMHRRNAFFQVPHAANKSHQARNVTLAELSKPGRYRIDIVLNDSGKVIRSYSYEAAGGKISPHPRSVIGYQPQADYVFPRAPDPRSSSYEWREVHWISG